MSDDASRTLFHPFDAGLIEPPGAGERVLFLGALPGFRLPRGFDAAIDAVQGLRPEFVELGRLGATVSPRASGDAYDMALVLCGRHRGQNDAWIAEALRRTRPGGLVVAGGGKSDGADSLRRRVGAVMPLAGHAAKHHGVTFWLERPALPPAPGGLPVVESGLVAGAYRTAPGMFSHGEADPGSRLLVAHMPERVAGRVADFGAGWGYLSGELLRRGATPASLDLYEADYESLEAARDNLAPLAGPGTTLGFHWHDLLREPVPRQYDLVLMNPPFHRGRAAEPSVGEGMIRTASAALKPGGRLLMVANRGLPYEKTLAAAFAQSGETVRDEGFKVLWARR